MDLFGYPNTESETRPLLEENEFSNMVAFRFHVCSPEGNYFLRHPQTLIERSRRDVGREWSSRKCTFSA